MILVCRNALFPLNHKPNLIAISDDAFMAALPTQGDQVIMKCKMQINLFSVERSSLHLNDFGNHASNNLSCLIKMCFIIIFSLSEYSDENMMDPYNLAICFGPTLVPVPEDKDQVQYQNLVNELIKNIIINAEDIFHNDGGTLYERYISREPDEG